MKNFRFLSPLLILTLLSSIAFCSSGCANVDLIETIEPVFHVKESGAWKKIQLPRLAVDEHFGQQLEQGRLAKEKDTARSNAIQQKVHALVAMQDFQGLEKAAQHYRTEEPFFSSGAMTIDQFYESIINFYMDTDASHPLRNGQYEGVRPLEFFIARWKKAYPHSDTAQMAFVNYCFAYGWKIRGDSYIQTVAEQEFKSFQEYMRKAEAALKMVEHPRALPEFYETQLLLGSGLPFSGGSLQHYLQEGKRYYPRHWPFHRNATSLLLYRWYGQPGDMNDYAKWAATQPKAPYSPLVMYARIANTVSLYTIRDPEGGSEFLSYGFSWPHVRAGYLLLAKEGLLFPDRFRSFLWMAVLYRDRETAKALFQAPEADSNAWNNPEMLLKAKQWANGQGEYPFYL